MTDIAKRLREPPRKRGNPHDELCDEAAAEIERLRASLVLITGFRSVPLAQEWPDGLCDIITSMIDCAERALEPKP